MSALSGLPERSEGTGRGPSPAAQDDLRVFFSPASVLTRAELLDHAKRPRNYGVLPDATFAQEEANPLCGDVVTMYAALHPTSYTLQAIRFVSSGCLISQAAASMLTEHAAGKTVADVLRMERSDIEALLGGTLSPSRVKCAMLPLVALKKGIQSLRGRRRRPAQSQRTTERSGIASLRLQ